MNFRRNLVFSILMSGCIASAFCQAKSDFTGKPTSREKEPSYAEQIYRSRIKDSTGFLNGRLNTFRYPGARGNPYFGDGNWISGNIVLDGRQFTGVNLRYEIMNDQLMCLRYTNDGPSVIEINSSFALQFGFGGHSFVNFKLKWPEINAEEGGYYEELVEGKASLYIKWKKYLTSPSTNHPAEYYLQKSTYILNHGKMDRLINRKSLLMAFNDHVVEIKNYMKLHHISRRSSDQEFAGLTSYYNSLH